MHMQLRPSIPPPYLMCSKSTTKSQVPNLQRKQLTQGVGQRKQLTQRVGQRQHFCYSNSTSHSRPPTQSTKGKSSPNTFPPSPPPPSPRPQARLLRVEQRTAPLHVPRALAPVVRCA